MRSARLKVGLRSAAVVEFHPATVHLLGVLRGWCAPNSCRGPNRAREGRQIPPRTLHRPPRCNRRQHSTTRRSPVRRHPPVQAHEGGHGLPRSIHPPSNRLRSRPRSRLSECLRASCLLCSQRSIALFVGAPAVPFFRGIFKSHLLFVLYLSEPRILSSQADEYYVDNTSLLKPNSFRPRTHPSSGTRVL